MLTKLAGPAKGKLVGFFPRSIWETIYKGTKLTIRDSLYGCRLNNTFFTVIQDHALTRGQCGKSLDVFEEVTLSCSGSYAIIAGG